MGSKMRLSTSCIERGKNPANLVTSRKIRMRLVHSIVLNAVRLFILRMLQLNVLYDNFYTVYILFYFQNYALWLP